MNIFTSSCFSQWIYVSLCHECYWKRIRDFAVQSTSASFIQSVKNDQNNIYVTCPVEKSQLKTLNVKTFKIPLALVTHSNLELTFPSGLVFTASKKYRDVHMHSSCSRCWGLFMFFLFFVSCFFFVFWKCCHG